jgi:hypothetical protein
MQGIEKIQAALSKEGTSEIGAVICYEDIFIRDHWKDLTSYPWWWLQSPNLDQRIRYYRQIYAEINQDWMMVPHCPSIDSRNNLYVDVWEDDIYLVNRQTGKMEKLIEPVIGGWDLMSRGYSGHVTHLARTSAEIDELIPIDSELDPIQFRQDGYADLADMLLEGVGKSLYPYAHIASPLWSCYPLWGFEGLMEMIATQEDVVWYAARRYLDRSIKQLHQAAALGAKGIWLEECLTDMIHPSAYSALNLPIVQNLIEEIHALGMQCIYYFCGNPAGKLDFLIQSGTDALALEESKKGFQIDIMDIARVVDGRCALLGNLDAMNMLPSATEADLQIAISRQIEAGQVNKNRFVMSLGSPVTPETSVDRVRLYCDLVHELGGTAAQV